jgi:hypothetical protein
MNAKERFRLWLKETPTGRGLTKYYKMSAPARFGLGTYSITKAVLVSLVVLGILEAEQLWFVEHIPIIGNKFFELLVYLGSNSQTGIVGFIVDFVAMTYNTYSLGLGTALIWSVFV